MHGLYLQTRKNVNENNQFFSIVSSDPGADEATDPGAEILEAVLPVVKLLSCLYPTGIIWYY